MSADQTLLEIYARLRAGKSFALELARQALSAIERVAPLNAFAAVQAEAAMEQARLVDAEIKAGQVPGPLAGVPVAIKDNIDQAGVVCAAACRAYLDRRPDRNAKVVERLLEAGAVIVGRTNMHELADGVTCEDSCYGPVHNPWRSGFHPGGSSGGSAAAVAAGCVAAALGTDTGGSVRIPASLCGVVGFKPTAGLVPNDGVVPLSTTLDHVGVLTRTVRDAAVVLEVLAGKADGDFQAACEGDPGGLRIGVLEGFGLEPDPGVSRAFEAARENLEEIGCALRPLSIEGLSRGIRLLSRIYPPEAAAWHEPALKERPEAFGDRVRADLERGLAMDPAKRDSALAERVVLTNEVEKAMEELDLLACPTTPHPARSIGALDPHTYLTYTCPFNLTGQPAISVPMGLSDGLPVGLQLIGLSGRDATVFRLASAFERT